MYFNKASITHLNSLFLQSLLKLLQAIVYGINTQCLTLKFTFLNMKPHEQLFFLRHIAMGRGGIEKVLHYLDDHLPATFSHPSKTMEDCDMLSFLHGVLQVYLEYWNSSSLLKNTFLILWNHQDVCKMSVHTW